MSARGWKRVARLGVWLGAGSYLGTLAASAALANETATYVYDDLGRLKSVTHQSGGSITYKYDKAGNRTEQQLAQGSSLVSFAVNDPPAVNEGGTVTFTVTKAGTASTSHSVNYSTASGTATSGSDFTAASGTLTFSVSESSKTFTVTTLDDVAVEGVETFAANLSGATGGATIADSSGIATINASDGVAVAFAINDPPAVDEGGVVTFIVTKSGSATLSHSVSYTTASGTATSGSDFTAASGTLTFSASDTSKSFTVTTTDDTVAEGAETFNAALSNATGGATISDSSGTATINASDTGGTAFSINDPPAVNEGASVVFTVTRSGPTTQTNAVSYATASGSAISGSDFASASGTLTFAAGDTAKTFSVATIDDTVTESAETFVTNLSNPTNGASVSDSAGTATINASDAPQPSEFSVDDPGPVSEGAQVVFTVTRTGPKSQLQSVSYSTSSGTAASGSDFTAVSGTLDFDVNWTTKTVVVQTIDDTATESTESFALTLSNPTNGAVLGDSSGTATINDAEGVPQAPGSISPSGYYYAGGGSYTISWTVAAGNPTYYELHEWRPGNVTGVVYSGPGFSKGFASQPTSGLYDYQVRACNTVGCGPFRGTASIEVCKGAACNQ